MGLEGQNKELLSRQFTKETELKAALTGSTRTRRAKGSPPKKAQAKILQLLRGVVSMVIRLLMNENQECQSRVCVTA